MADTKKIGRVKRVKSLRSKRKTISPDMTAPCRQFLKMSVVVENKTAKRRENPPVMMRLFFGGIK